MKPRLFIGNLPSTVTDEELRDKFESLLSSHKEEARVGDVQVRCKNENNYFGFVDIHIQQDNDTKINPTQPTTGMGSIPLFLRKSIDLMNNTKWKGSLIKVQLAKESFIEKLKREQEKHNEETKQQFASVASKRQDDLSTEQNRNKRHANDILYKLRKSTERHSIANSQHQFSNNETGKIKERDYGFEVVARNNNKTTTNSRVPTVLEDKIRKQNAPKGMISSSEDDTDEEDQVRDGIPKFKGLLVNFPQEKFIAEKNEHKKQETVVIPQKKVLSVASDSSLQKTEFPKEESSKVNSNNPGINFKKNKQQRSDLLRLQSIEKLKELKTQRMNIIKSSLSTVTAAAPITDQHKLIENLEEESSNNKRSKMTLFDDEDEADSNGLGDEFTVKKQFEGVGGQKLLEMKTKWGNDDRFKIDDRFKDDNDNKEESIELVEQEKEQQLSILTDIIGKTVTSIRSVPATGKMSSVILPRYDPEAEETPDIDEESNKIKMKDKSRSKENLAATPPVPQQPIRSTEPATFKTVSNLKTLFSSGETVTQQKTFEAEKSSFSLLATFGIVDQDKMEVEEKNHATTSEPRSFWQSNPFKYDSSDEEEEEKVKTRLDKTAQSAPTTTLILNAKHSFFFKANDPRLQGVEDYFLKGDEVREDTAEKSEKKEVDFSEKRQELKSIVKAKIRNSKRKDEKRTLAIKRAIRQRKRKLHKGNRVNTYSARTTA